MFPSGNYEKKLSFLWFFVISSVLASQNKSRSGRQYHVFDDAIVRQEYTVSDSPPLIYQFASSGGGGGGSGPGPVHYVQQSIPGFQSSQFSLPSGFYGGGNYRPQSSGFSESIPPYPGGGSINYHYKPHPYYGPQPQTSISSGGSLHSSILSSLLSAGYKPGKPPSSYGWGPSGSFASASASAGGSSFGVPSAIASSSAHSHNYGWRPPPPPPPPSSPLPTANNQISPTQGYGWGPIIHPAYPTRPIPEFTHQFSLKPSSFGWETSYNVPCGNYKIQPRVLAHLRLATQAVLPKPNSKSFTDEDEDWGARKRKRSLPQNQDVSYLDPFNLERSLQYSPYEQQQFSVPRPTFRPRTCRWNFNAVGECKLNFKCGWFQLPALFRCEENYLHVTDNTILLDSKFCGNRRPRRIYSSTSGKLTLTFKSEGAALPAIFDCTVLCSPLDSPSGELKTSPAPTEISTDEPSSAPSTLPILVHHQNKGTSSFVSPNQRNTTIIVKTPSKPQLRMGRCKCGVPDSHYSSKAIHGRIVGGSSMIPGESPWTAALVKKNSNRPYCGASLINSRFLLTAGHCVLDRSQTKRTRESGSGGNDNDNGTRHEDRIYFDVLLNEHDISQRNEIAGGTIRARVDQVILHPAYDNVTFDFDAALLRLAEPVEFNLVETDDKASSASHFKSRPAINPFIHGAFDFHSLGRKRRFVIPEIEARAIPPKPVPICLPEISDRKDRKSSLPEPDEFAVVTGWGLTAEGGVPSNEMLKARVQIFNDTTCQELYKKHNYVITSRMVCAGYLNGNTDSCVGDSGSPLAMEDGNRFILTGVVSWGRGCGRKQLPGVYTRVDKLMDWIYSEAAKDDSVWCS